MNHRRLVSIDPGIAAAHTVRVLDGEGAVIAKRKAWPTVESLTAAETAALAGCPQDTGLEVVIEPTGRPGCGRGRGCARGDQPAGVRQNGQRGRPVRQ